MINIATMHDDDITCAFEELYSYVLENNQHHGTWASTEFKKPSCIVDVKNLYMVVCFCRDNKIHNVYDHFFGQRRMVHAWVDATVAVFEIFY